MKGINLIHTNEEFLLELDGKKIEYIESYNISATPDRNIHLTVTVDRPFKESNIKILTDD